MNLPNSKPYGIVRWLWFCDCAVWTGNLRFPAARELRQRGPLAKCAIPAPHLCSLNLYKLNLWCRPAILAPAARSRLCMPCLLPSPRAKSSHLTPPSYPSSAMNAEPSSPYPTQNSVQSAVSGGSGCSNPHRHFGLYDQHTVLYATQNYFNTHGMTGKLTTSIA